MTRTVPVALSAVLWDRAVDSIGQDHGHPAYGRRAGWVWTSAGFGRRATLDVPVDVAVAILRYLDALGSLDGSGMDPDGAADTRAEARAARSAAATLRRRLAEVEK